MNIIVDAFGGDNAPLEVIKGCKIAEENLGVKITLTGNREIIERISDENGIDIDGMDIIHTDSVIDIHESRRKLLKAGRTALWRLV